LFFLSRPRPPPSLHCRFSCSSYAPRSHKKEKAGTPPHKIAIETKNTRSENEKKQESIKSKRHLKSLLTSLKSSGKVKTTPNASGRSYGYSVKQAPRQKMEIE
jgi:hypothetical protein